MNTADKYNELLKQGDYDEADKFFVDIHQTLDILVNKGLSVDESTTKMGITADELQAMTNDYIGRNRKFFHPGPGCTPRYEKMNTSEYQYYLGELERYVTGAGEVLKRYQRSDVNMEKLLSDLLGIYSTAETALIPFFLKYRSMPYDKEIYLKNEINTTYNALENEYGIVFTSTKAPSLSDIISTLIRVQGNKNKTESLKKKYKDFRYYHKLLQVKNTVTNKEAVYEKVEKLPNKSNHFYAENNNTIVKKEILVKRVYVLLIDEKVIRGECQDFQNVMNSKEYASKIIVRHKNNMYYVIKCFSDFMSNDNEKQWEETVLNKLNLDKKTYKKKRCSAKKEFQEKLNDIFSESI